MKLANHLLLVFLLLFAAQVLAGGFKVDKPWIREAPPGMKILAGYMTLENEKNEALNMVGASSADFESIEIHHTIIKDDMASMIRQQSVRIPRFSTVKFEPNGLHLMLIKPRRELRGGDKVKITLKFSNYRKVKVVFQVRKGGR
ncbi:MAG: copper chaperone PCu(A)C [Acidiferrobacterales bacterium]